MQKRWLLLDANCLCWRSYHSTGALKWGETQTGTVYGFLRDVRGFMETFNTDNVIFCWDFGEPLRKRIYPGYKASRETKRKKMNPLEKIAYEAFKKQVQLIRTTYLKEIGFRNNFWATGFEADDLIAQFCADLPKRDQIVIVSSDKDFYQLLDDRVRIYHPITKKAVTAESFWKQWELPPLDWCIIKVIAGCVSDEIKGIEGVGEITAAKYLRREASAKQFALIESSASQRVIKRSIPLVLLPFADTPSYDLRKDCVTKQKWTAIADKLGMRSLRSWE
jgi:5'-3' exonuclease